MVVYSLRSSGEIRPVLPAIPVSIQEIDPGNVGRVLEFRNDIDTRKFEDFLKAGDMGIYAVAGSKAIGHLWARICRGDRIRVDGFLRIRRGEAVIHFATVHEDYRGKNIYSFMLSHLCDDLFRKGGVKRIYVVTEEGNIPSIRGIEKTGFSESERRLYVPFYRLFRVEGSLSGPGPR